MTHFLAKGHKKGSRDRSLSITYVDDDAVHVVIVSKQLRSIRVLLARDVPFNVIINAMEPNQFTQTVVPIKSLESVSWSDCNDNVIFRYDDAAGSRTVRTYINSKSTRDGLIAALEKHLGRPFRREDQHAGLIRATWPNMVGAALSLAGAAVMYFAWDPKFLPGGLGGWIARRLGPAGCGLVGLAFFVGCCWHGYQKLRKHPRVFRCLV